MGRSRRCRVQDKTVIWNEYQDGKRRQRQVSFPTAREAKVQADKLNARMTLGLIGPTAPVVCLQEAVRYFLAAIREAGLADSTRKGYATSLGLLYRTTGDIPVNDITPAHIDAYLARVRANSSSEANPSRYYREARRFLRWCVNQEYVRRDVTQSVTRKPRQDTVADRPRLDHADVDAIVNACDTDDRRLAVLIGATTGIDRKQVERLVGDDIDWDGGYFKSARIKVGRKYSPPIHDDLLHQLRQRAVRTSPGQRLLNVGSYQSHYGGRDWFQRAAKLAGLEGVVYKDLRKYATRYLIRALGSLEEASKRLHANIATTQKHYFQPDPQAQRKVSKHPLPGSLRAAESQAG